MDCKRFLPRLCLLLTVALTLSAVILRTVAFLSGFDADVGYFSPSAIITLNRVLYFITAAFLIAAVSLIPKKTLPAELNTPLRLPAALLMGLALIGFSVAAFILCVPTADSRLLLAPVVLGLPAAAYFLLSSSRNGRYSDSLSFPGFFPVIWAVSAIGDLYFDQHVTMNSPIKISLHLGLLGFMFIVLFELRFRIGRPAPRAAIVAYGLGCFACLNASVPLLIATGAQVLDHRLQALYAVVLLLAGLYGLYVLYGYTASASAVSESTETSSTVEHTDGDE